MSKIPHPTDAATVTYALDWAAKFTEHLILGGRNLTKIASQTIQAIPVKEIAQQIGTVEKDAKSVVSAPPVRNALAVGAAGVATVAAGAIAAPGVATAVVVTTAAVTTGLALRNVADLGVAVTECIANRREAKKFKKNFLKRQLALQAQHDLNKKIQGPDQQKEGPAKELPSSDPLKMNPNTIRDFPLEIKEADDSDSLKLSMKPERVLDPKPNAWPKFDLPTIKDLPYERITAARTMFDESLQVVVKQVFMGPRLPISNCANAQELEEEVSKHVNLSQLGLSQAALWDMFCNDFGGKKDRIGELIAYLMIMQNPDGHVNRFATKDSIATTVGSLIERYQSILGKYVDHEYFDQFVRRVGIAISLMTQHFEEDETDNISTRERIDAVENAAMEIVDEYLDCKKITDEAISQAATGYKCKSGSTKFLEIVLEILSHKVPPGPKHNAIVAKVALLLIRKEIRDSVPDDHSQYSHLVTKRTVVALWRSHIVKRASTDTKRLQQAIQAATQLDNIHHEQQQQGITHDVVKELKALKEILRLLGFPLTKDDRPLIERALPELSSDALNNLLMR